MKEKDATETLETDGGLKWGPGGSTDNHMLARSGSGWLLLSSGGDVLWRGKSMAAFVADFRSLLTVAEAAKVVREEDDRTGEARIGIDDLYAALDRWEKHQ